MVVPSLSAEEAPYVAGVAIRRRERRPHWGRHLPHGVTVAQLLGSNLESGDRARDCEK